MTTPSTTFPDSAPEPHPDGHTGSDVWIAQFNERMALRSRDAAREAASESIAAQPDLMREYTRTHAALATWRTVALMAVAVAVVGWIL